MPETGIDPIVASAGLVNALQGIASRRIGAGDAAVASITQIHGGDTWDVAPETVVLRGTVRTLDAEVQDQVETARGQICRGIAQAHGAQVDLNYMRRYPGVVNTPAETNAAAKAAARLVGRRSTPTSGLRWDRKISPSCCRSGRGAYICIGAGETANDSPLHNSYYDFNDAILPLGAAYWVELAKQQLPAA
jgi:metal-dependent amidase/aminoacylase/carboxypeptidase family protein